MSTIDINRFIIQETFGGNPYSDWVKGRANKDIRHISWATTEMTHVLIELLSQWRREDYPRYLEHHDKVSDLKEGLSTDRASQFRFINFLDEVGITEDEDGKKVYELGKIPGLFRLFDTYIEEKDTQAMVEDENKD